METKRNTVKNLEKILHEELPVLDKGFVRVVDYMGDDSAIVQAARVSYGKGTKHSSQDQALINYLMRNNHTTPFEMCEIKLHVKLPIFVARQWIRHRTASVNEYSARYSILDNEFYIPAIENIATQSKSNNQGREEEALPTETAIKIQKILNDDAVNCYQHYESLLSQNLTRELARINLTANFYTQWYWKIDLKNLLHFIKLRNDKHAQFEIREYAGAIMDVVKEWVPMTYDAFVQHKMNSVSLSQNAIQLIKKALKGEEVDYREAGLSKREWDEINEVFEIFTSELAQT